jgi:hypothetical protein
MFLTTNRDNRPWSNTGSALVNEAEAKTPTPFKDSMFIAHPLLFIGDPGLTEGRGSMQGPADARIASPILRDPRNPPMRGF